MAYVDSQGASDAAIGVAQTQAQLSGLPTVSDRTDLKIEYGNWDIYKANSDTAWTATDGSSTSNSNAVRVSIQRADGVAFGPVTNILAGILGSPTSEVRTMATGTWVLPRKPSPAASPAHCRANQPGADCSHKEPGRTTAYLIRFNLATQHSQG